MKLHHETTSLGLGLDRLLLVPVLLARVDLVSEAEGHSLGFGPNSNVACETKSVRTCQH